MSGKPATAALGRLGRPGAFQEVALEIAATLPILVDRGFTNRANPERSAWARRKDARSHPLLELTRRMRTTVLAVITGTVIRLTSPTSYLRFHQDGTRKMVARRLAPKGAMTPDWKREVDLRAKNKMRELQRA